MRVVHLIQEAIRHQIWFIDSSVVSSVWFIGHLRDDSINQPIRCSWIRIMLTPSKIPNIWSSGSNIFDIWRSFDSTGDAASNHWIVLLWFIDCNERLIYWMSLGWFGWSVIFMLPYHVTLCKILKQDFRICVVHLIQEAIRHQIWFINWSVVMSLWFIEYLRDDSVNQGINFSWIPIA